MNHLLYPILLIIVLNAQAANPILIASIPKCGTFLLAECVKKITPITLCHAESDHLVISDKDIQKKKNIVGHALPALNDLNKLREAGYKIIFIYRDPRDQAVSMIRMTKETTWFPHLKKIPFDNALTHWISHTSALYTGKNHWVNPELKMFKGVNDLYHRYLQWLDYVDEGLVYVTTYERLAGPKSGGSEEIQVQELINIAQHIGAELPRDKAIQIARTIHGPVKPDRKKIGTWKKFFKRSHIEQFKKVAGSLLIDLGYESDLNW